MRTPHIAVLLSTVLLSCSGKAEPHDSASPATRLDTLPLAEQVVAQGMETFPPEIVFFDWIPTVFAWGVHRTHAASGDATYQGWYRAWMDAALVDFTGEHFESSDATSPALLASTLMWEDGSTDYTTITDAADAYIAAVPRASNGAMVHWGPDNPWGFDDDQVWVDSQFMLGLYLLQEGRRTGDDASIDAFVAQYVAFHALLSDPDDHLYRHAWDDGDSVHIPVSASYWARGNAWALVAGAELLRAVGPDDPRWDTVAPLWTEHVAAILPLQAEDGLWHTVLNRADDPANYTETSASALIGYALVVGIHADVPLDDGAVRRAVLATVQGVESRLSQDASGVWQLTGTSTGTNPGEYEDYIAVPQLDDLMLGWGAVAMFLAEAHGLEVP